MDSSLKKILRALSLELRHTLEGYYDPQGVFHPGDLERRLNELGVWHERPARPLEELPHLTPEDKAARQVIDAYFAYRMEADVSRADAVAEFVRESAYTWSNRLFALRCMEARGIIDEVILQKEAYGGRSLAHHRLARRDPAASAGTDEGLFAVLFDEFKARAAELPELFDPQAPAVALRPSLSALKRCIAILSGTESVGSQEPASDQVFAAHDALGWAYQYWNSEEKDRVFEKVRTQKGAKIEGADIIPATQLYTEPYMVKFLVQNSLGALWMGMHSKSKLAEGWEYYVKDADRAPVEQKPVSEITFLDPAAGSGHFLLEAFDLLFPMYQEEAKLQGIGEATTPEEIAALILNNNLFAIDIDSRAIQIAIAALWMKAKEYAPDLQARALTSFHEHLVATDIRLPKGKDHLKVFLDKHPEAAPLRPALETIFDGLQNVHVLGSLVQIEELVENELRYLKEQFDAARGRPEQLTLLPEMCKPRQGELPLGVESYEQWKTRILADLEQHLTEEVEAADSAQAFFGRSAYKGIAILDLLTRSYDVVTTNPPWMGSKNMGGITYSYLTSHYPEGKRDVYAAFILRCYQLCGNSGYVAMITQQSWLFLKTFSQLRSKSRSGTPQFDGLLHVTTIETLVQLGRYAFSELGNAVIQPVMFTVRKRVLNDKHRIYTIRLKAPRLSEEQAEKIRLSAKQQIEGVVSIIEQSTFLNIPDSPVVYWLPDSYLNLPISTNRRSTDLFISKGIDSCNQTRFMRFIWEVQDNNRYWQYAKGGTHCKWYGLNMYVIDWEMKGARIRSSLIERHPIDKLSLLIQHETLYGDENLTYSAIAQGAMGARYNAKGLFSGSGPGIFWRGSGSIGIVLCLLNTRVCSYLLRGLTAGGLSFFRAYVEKCPITSYEVSKWESQFNKNLPIKLIKAKEWLASHDIREKNYSVYIIPADTIYHKFLSSLLTRFAVISCVLELEGINERLAFSLFDIPENDITRTLDETGTPTGWFPLLKGYEVYPQKSISEIGFLSNLDSYDMEAHAKGNITVADKVSEFKKRLRSIYESGSGLKEEREDEIVYETDRTDEGAVVGAYVPIPTESFLEEIAQKLQIHPISVYWLLKEGIEHDGWRCPPEEKRLAEDTFTVLVLRLLGHRWPKQIEAGEPAPDWADIDGIIPLTTAFGEQTLLERVRARIPDEFPGGSIAAIEREFEEIVGEPLERWLSGSFFKRHISQFKKRPIAWQLSSTQTNGKKKKGISKTPAFSCLVYYHKLDADLLPKLRTQYVGPLRQRYETELRTLDSIAFLTADQSERRIQLEAWIDELRDFEAHLEAVDQSGFANPGLEKLLSAEPLDAWTSRDGCVPLPGTHETFFLQEQRYDPDLNDGVRVNIAPLQKAGLLAANVLDAKDLDKAIADRAAWRADERRWCREGKLPMPGWWK